MQSETMFWKLELLDNVESKDAKWCILTQFETMFWKLELLDNVESKDAKWCILTQFETMFFMLELLRTFRKQGHLIVQSDVIWNDVLEVGTFEKKKKDTKPCNVLIFQFSDYLVMPDLPTFTFVLCVFFRIFFFICLAFLNE